MPLGNFFNRIEQATKTNGTSELAELLGVEPGAVSNWKKGRNRPNYEAIFSICKSQKINLHWLLTGEGEMLLENIRGFDEKEEAYLKLGKRLYEVWGLLQTLEPEKDHNKHSENGGLV